MRSGRSSTARRAVLVRSAVALAVCLVAFSAPAATPPESASARQIFDRHAGRVAQIEVVERRSGTKTSIGSGFAVGEPTRGRVATNFHVIADLVHEPDRFRANLVAPDGTRHPATVIALDVVRDLALVTSSHRFEDGIAIRESPIAQGERLYSLGNPFDLGLSIVEGTYNGHLGHSLEQKIHFTGSLNPGMSGGPALDGAGALVGVNVATSGNQVSFLVPAAALRELLAAAPESASPPPDAAALRAVIGEQLRAFQQRYVDAVLATPPAHARIGRADAPTRPASFFNCWGDVQRDAELLYEARTHECSSDDAIFLSKRVTITPLQLRHRHLESQTLSPSRFFSTFSDFFEANHSEKWGSARDFTAFRCQTGFVRSEMATLKTAFCARRFVDYEGLYDVVFKAALLGQPQRGLETALVLSGVEFENAQRLARRHLEGIAWSD